MLVAIRLCWGQDSSPNQSWTSNSHQESPSETWNPIRTHQIHTERDGRVLDHTAIETIGLDGRYVPYMDIERETVRVDAETVRILEKTFAPGPNGETILIQERREETLNLPEGALRVTGVVSNPDANGRLQIVQQEFTDSKQLSTGDRETNSIVLMPNSNEALAPVMQAQEAERRRIDGTIEVKRSIWLSDGTGHWQLTEVRSGLLQELGPRSNQQESVLRPDSAGTLELVEQTIRMHTKTGPHEENDVLETYSTTIPGVAGEHNLQIVQRESSSRRNSASEVSITGQAESVAPGSINTDLHVTDESLEVARPAGSGIVKDNTVVYSVDANGHVRQVWINLGETDKPFTADFNGQRFR